MRFPRKILLNQNTYNPGYNIVAKLKIYYHFYHSPSPTSMLWLTDPLVIVTDYLRTNNFEMGERG